MQHSADSEFVVGEGVENDMMIDRRGPVALPQPIPQLAGLRVARGCRLATQETLQECLAIEKAVDVATRRAGREQSETGDLFGLSNGPPSSSTAPQRNAGGIPRSRNSALSRK